MSLPMSLPETTARAGDDGGQIEIRSTMFRVTFLRLRS